jgi:hypothetical protein
MSSGILRPGNKLVLARVCAVERLGPGAAISFEPEEMGAVADAAERVRVVLTDALHNRGPNAASLHLLTGSKGAIRLAIAEAIVASKPARRKERTS